MVVIVTRPRCGWRQSGGLGLKGGTDKQSLRPPPSDISQLVKLYRHIYICRQVLVLNIFQQVEIYFGLSSDISQLVKLYRHMSSGFSFEIYFVKYIRNKTLGALDF